MGNNKRLVWTDADVRCPFYLSDDKNERSIRCEGYGKGVETVSRFPSALQQDRHMGRYCVGLFETCPVYRCTYGCKYAD